MLDIAHGNGWVGEAPKEGDILIPSNFMYLDTEVIDTDWEVVKSNKIDYYTFKIPSSWQKLRSFIKKAKNLSISNRARCIAN